MAQAAIHLRLRSTSGDVPEVLNRPLWQRYRRNTEKNQQVGLSYKIINLMLIK